MPHISSLRFHKVLVPLISLVLVALWGVGTVRAQTLETDLSQGVRLQIRVVEDTADHFLAVVDSATKAPLTFAPKIFPLRAGEEVVVVTSRFPPQYLTVKKDGELTFTPEAPMENCTFRIERSPGGNLIKNDSFEEGGEALPAAWQGVRDRVTRPSLAYGHEGISEGVPSSAQPTTAPPSDAAVQKGQAHTGQNSVKIRKTDPTANFLLKHREPIALEPGKEYTASAWLKIPKVPLGSTLHFVGVLRSPGQPDIQCRDFYLNPLISNEGQWRRTEFQCKVPATYKSPSLELFLAAQGTPFEIQLDDVRLSLTPSAVTQLPELFEPEERLPLYSKDEVLEVLAARKPTEARVRSESGSISVEFNGEKVPLFGYVTGPARWPAYGPLDLFSQVGMRLQWVPLWSNQNGVNYGKPIWLGPGRYDFAPVDEILETVLRRNPQQTVLFYLGLFTYPEFGDRYPDAIWRSASGKKTIGTKQTFREVDNLPDQPKGSDDYWNISYTAEDFRREAGEFLQALGHHLARSPYGKAVAGIHLVSGSDGQWFCPGEPDHYDRSPAHLKAFREWLTRKYQTDENLQKSWGDAKVTLKTAALPAEEERSPDQYFLEAEDQRVIDANAFSSEGVVETINGLARAFKQGMSRPTLVTTYYHDILHNHMTNHFALRRLLTQPDLDGVVSVEAGYGLTRTLGRSGSYNSLAASLRLHGKLYLSELDYRTNLSWLPPDAMKYRKSWGVPGDAEGWANQMRRDLGMVLCQGQGAWLYALGGNAWKRPPYMRGVEEGVHAAELAQKYPMPEDRGQIAIFCDERIQDVTTRKNIFGPGLSMVAFNLVRVPLSQSGLSWDAYLLSDLADPKRPAYKINIILAANTLQPEQVAWIRENLQKNGNVVVFLNAIGSPSVFAEMSAKVTGMHLELDLSKVGVHRLRNAPSKDRLAVGWPFQYTEITSPLFSVNDPEATPLALYEGSDKVAAAVRRSNDWTSVYIGLPGALTPTFLRALAQDAGIEPIGPEGDVTYAGNGFLVLHALTSGEKTFRWKGHCDVYDLKTRTKVASNVEEFKFPIQALETAWFQRRKPTR